MGLALLINVISGGPPLLSRSYPRDAAILRELGIGTIGGILAALIVSGLTDFVPILRDVRQQAISVMRVEEIGLFHAVVLGLVAGIPEELLFRGALQPLIGILGAAILFGAAHAVTRAYLLYALIAGLGLGGLAAWRGDLWAVTAAHSVYDACLFVLLARWMRNQTASKARW